MNNACITSLGLVLNLIGAILLAFSFSASEKVGTHTDGKGKTTDFVLPDFHKCLFRSGILIMAAGFLLQLIAVMFLKNI